MKDQDGGAGTMGKRKNKRFSYHFSSHWTRDEKPARRKSRATRLYRLPHERRLAGVCAGIANLLGIDAFFVRLGWFLSLFIFNLFPIIVYILLWILMPVQPETLYRDEKEEAFWQGVKREPRGSIQGLHLQYRKLEHRLRAMESEVTSAQYRFDAELNGNDSKP